MSVEQTNITSGIEVKKQNRASILNKVFMFLLLKKTNAFFAVLRSVCPLLYLKRSNLVVVTRYEDVLQALSQPSSLRVVTAEKIERSVGAFMLGRDDCVENHRDKAIMQQVMRCDDAVTIRLLVEDRCRKIIDECRQRGEIDLVPSYSRRVPVLMAASYFGFATTRYPPAELERSMFRWARDTQRDIFFNHRNDPEIHRRSVVAGRELRAYLRELIPQRQLLIDAGGQAEDVLSRLLRMKFDNGFNRECIVSNMAGMLIGTVETSSKAVVHIINQLLLRPKTFAAAKRVAVAGDDSLLLKYCWEALRFQPLSPVVTRFCASDIHLAQGRTINRGSKVLIAVQSAMHDGRALDRPRDFRVDRPAEHYLHMGYGQHRCVGERVADLMVPVMVRHLLLLPDLRAMAPIETEGGFFPDHFKLGFTPC
ncbi:cytochrome P450 [Sinobacterium caligoides]|uniref:Cytochrome P450 n=1 Tax=Sinobacterium caligoides TaxID=933926 RepID=A0A3N2DYP7_9GAMM|nr:cytochrome P450 [Sinobacterium caligoides]ROS04973.1 cytochrome P450 [Sinobacterium caligoides]